MTPMTTAHQIWLMRRLTDKQSLLFSLSATLAEESGVVYADLLGMEEQGAIGGRTPEEALDNARMLFMATVDDAMAKGASIQFATGQQPITLDLPIWMAERFFHLLEAHLSEQAEADERDWVKIAPSTKLELQHA